MNRRLLPETKSIKTVENNLSGKLFWHAPQSRRERKENPFLLRVLGAFAVRKGLTSPFDM
jgi:hypothetical protein